MKLVIQRVKQAGVTVDGREVSRIGPGALILVGVAKNNTSADIKYLARKTSQLRIYDDEQGKLNAAIDACKGTFLAVSQFTLYADCAKGNRPSYIEAAQPEDANRLYEDFCRELRLLGHVVQTGVFGGRIAVDLVNDDPVTIILESRGRAQP